MSGIEPSERVEGLFIMMSRSALRYCFIRITTSSAQ